MITVNKVNTPADDKPLVFERDAEDFRMVAVRAHGNQKYGDLPYAFHLASVENILTNSGYTAYRWRAAAWLHDILEDTDYTQELLIQQYGVEIYNMVAACTGVGANRKERNASIYAKCQQVPDGAIVKTADRLANMRHGLLTKNPKVLMYVEEYYGFSQAIRPLVTATTAGALLWAALDDVASAALHWGKMREAEKDLATVHA